MAIIINQFKNIQLDHVFPWHFEYCEAQLYHHSMVVFGKFLHVCIHRLHQSKV